MANRVTDTNLSAYQQKQGQVKIPIEQLQQVITQLVGKAPKPVSLSHDLVIYQIGSELESENPNRNPHFFALYHQESLTDSVNIDPRGMVIGQDLTQGSLLYRTLLDIHKALQPPSSSQDSFQGSSATAAAHVPVPQPKASKIHPSIKAWGDAIKNNPYLKEIKTLDEFNEKATATEKEAREKIIEVLFQAQRIPYFNHEEDILFEEGNYGESRSLKCVEKNPYILEYCITDQPHYYSKECDLITGDIKEINYHVGMKFSNFFNAP